MNKNDNYKLFSIVVLISLLSILSFYIAMANVTTIVNFPSTTVKKQLFALFPEGWGFFTKSPRETMVDIYKKQDQENWKRVNISNSSRKNLFGFSRKARVMGIDIDIILRNIAKEDFIAFTGNFMNNIPDRIYTIEYDKSFQFINVGEYLIVERKIIPWFYAQSAKEKDVPGLIMRIEIK
ncbi:SdpA family antimicrobial peptide system protein [Sinomicrobium kalidii]|uniref:SdpA family antimicrobial peptide system protein n=1 Tax=Sinomicrobium kalidii TaxID=2900738 RepID=UPI001E532442|nr:SdpA family antimicrobial peptide system protein [Sinomicrobium kalidii]UGU15382.1 SdpA family antimicrobial peptide system protein [Sinomicrobium kalidii]